MRKIVILLTLIFTLNGIKGQEESAVSFNAGIDLYSRYVWRGLLFSATPNVQPYMSISWKGFTAMAWASYSTSKTHYGEYDLFLSYNIAGLTLNLNDYYTQEYEDANGNLISFDYNEWDRELTSHLIEASVVYQLPSEGFPLQFTVSTFIYGADLDENADQNYSTYLEANYPFTFKDYTCAFFVGGTTHKGYYANDAAFVNTGFKVAYPIKITETFSLPVNMSLIHHPYNHDMFFVVGISL